MRRIFRQATPASHGDLGNERPTDVSADLPYELQSKMLDQLTTVSVAGTGLAITLIGSLLQDAPREVWLSVVFFGLAAITAITGNIRLVEGIFERKPVLRRSKRDVALTMMLIGAAAGFLSMSTYSQHRRAPRAAVEAGKMDSVQKTAPAARTDR